MEDFGFEVGKIFVLYFATSHFTLSGMTLKE
jgi:hypothetical protein